jgi:hypothetical protein
LEDSKERDSRSDTLGPGYVYEFILVDLAVVFGQLFFAEADDAVFEGENRVVFAHGGVLAREVFGAALSDDDVSGFYGLSAEDFYAKSFGYGIASVTRGAGSFLMCHSGAELVNCWAWNGQEILKYGLAECKLQFLSMFCKVKYGIWVCSSRLSVVRRGVFW